MILLNFGSWWSGAKMSYLRYLTFKTLRHFHPHSRIQLFTNYKPKIDGSPILQEFSTSYNGKDYLPLLSNLGIEIVPISNLSNLYPHQQADIYRWSFLKFNGGIYIDPDQIILKSFKSLPIDKYNFIYSSYKVDSSYAFEGSFSPIGVLGSSKNSKIVNQISASILKYREDGNYNSLGVLMMADMIKKIDMSDGFNAPYQYFYPAPICNYIEKVYNGTLIFPKDSLSVHWYGGYAPSQEFNRKYTEDFARKSNDSISFFLRKSKII